MKTKIGLWIDHKKAIVVAMTAEGEDIKVIASNVEKQLRRSGDSPLKGPYESYQVPADDSRQRAFSGDLDVYYEEVTEHVRAAEEILIFGPGEAKGELKAHLEKNNLGDRIVGVETEDKMTDRQIASKVRLYFHK